MLRVGLIGCGGMGNTHAGAYAVLKDQVKVVAIADEEVPLADGVQDVTDDEADSLLTIEEDEVPLAAAPVAKEKMSWWWLLIVALMGATGYKMYEKHQEKKELKK